MITSSNFFKKTLFEDDPQGHTEWHKQKPAFKVSESVEQRKAFVIPRAPRKSLQLNEATQIFKKQKEQRTLPTLSSQLTRTPNNAPSKPSKPSRKQYIEQLNFIKEYVGSRKKKQEQTRSKSRYKTLDQSVHINTRNVFSYKPLEDSPRKHLSVSLTPEMSAYNFIRLARERINRARVSIL